MDSRDKPSRRRVPRTPMTVTSPTPVWVKPAQIALAGALRGQHHPLPNPHGVNVGNID